MKTICKHAYLSDICGTCNPPAKEKANDRLALTTFSRYSDSDSMLSDAIERIRKYEWTNAARVAVDQIPAQDLASAYDWTATYLVELERRISSENVKGMAVGRDGSPPAGKSL